MINDPHCPICEDTTLAVFDYVDFNKYCTITPEAITPSGFKICYKICPVCNYLVAVDLCNWEKKQFEDHIYNKDYIVFDPDYVEKRPHQNHKLLSTLIKSEISSIRHLDYGGGNGLLSSLMKRSGWDSESYEPFSTASKFPHRKFNVITAFEVLEHVPNPNVLMQNIIRLMEDSAIFIFSTLLSDGNIKLNEPLNWWYAAPRNGHISLFSKRSLEILSNKYYLDYTCLNNSLHVFSRKSILV